MGSNESSNLDELPEDVLISLKRIGASEFFKIRVNDSPVAEIVHQDGDFFRAAAYHLHTARVREELDRGIL